MEHIVAMFQFDITAICKYKETCTDSDNEIAPPPDASYNVKITLRGRDLIVSNCTCPMIMFVIAAQMFGKPKSKPENRNTTMKRQKNIYRYLNKTSMHRQW